MTTVTKQPQKAANPGVGRRERRRTETREKLYRAAMKLFGERGFFETTTEAITEAADVGQGTFFNYFPTKQHVLTVLAEKQIEKIMAARHKANDAKHSIRDVLHALMHTIAEEPGQSPPLTRSLLTALISSDAVREFSGDTMARGRQSLGKIIKLGQKQGEIRSDRKAADLAMAFQRAVLGTLLLWAMRPRGNLSSWLDESFKDYWAGAAARKGRTR